MALASYQSGMVERSVDYFAQAVAFSPGSAELLLAAALANYEAGNLSRAEGLAIDAAEMASDAYLKESDACFCWEMYIGVPDGWLKLFKHMKPSRQTTRNQPMHGIMKAWYSSRLMRQSRPEPPGGGRLQSIQCIKVLDKNWLNDKYGRKAFQSAPRFHDT
jgi:hypothetical protein